MAPSNGNTAVGSQGSSAPPFSYAQAAKGKSSASSSTVHASTKPPMSSSQSKESISTASTNPATESKFSWADDAADASTLVEHGTPHGSPSHSAVNQRTDSSSPPDGQDDVTGDGRSQTSAQNIESQIEDKPKGTSDVSPSPRSAKDPDWRRRSSVLEHNIKQSNASQDQMDDLDGKPEPKPLTEAPIPAVNIWTQRAQERKPKQPPATPSLTSNTSVGSVNNERQNNAAAAKNSQATASIARQQLSQAPTHKEATTAHPVERSSVQPSNSRGNTNSRRQSHNVVQSHDVLDSRSTIQTQPKSLDDTAKGPFVDTMNWPTPETAQDEERRKPADKVDKSETERGISQGSKAHGKQEWVHIPFIPTVKFETPIPPNSRHGGRGGNRGNRDVGGRGGVGHAATSRGGPNATGIAGSDGLSDNVRRGRAGSTSAMASSVTMRGRSARRPVSAHGVASHAAASTHEVQQYQDPDKDDPHSNNRKQIAETDKDASKGTWMVPSDSTTSTAPSLAGGVTGETQPSNGAPLNEKRRSIATQTDVVAESAQYGTSNNNRKRGVSSATTPGEFNSARATDRRRSGSNAHKSYWPDRRFEGSSRPHEMSSILPFRDRTDSRPERGRGGRGGRGGFAHPHPPTHLQLHGHGTNHKSGSSQPPQSSPFPEFQSFASSNRGYRPPPRAASITTDSPHSRTLPTYPPTPQPASQGGGMQGYGTTQSVPALQYDLYVQEMVLMNGVANQLNHYFSIDNLCRDIFLRRHMDSKGFVSLKFIAGFARMKQLTEDFEFIKSTIVQSPDFEMRTGFDGTPCIRRKTEWEKFVLNMEDRDPSAQNDGPPALEEAPFFSPQVMENSSMFRSPFGVVSSFPARANESRSQHGQFFQTFAPLPTPSPVNGLPLSPSSRYSLSAVEGNLSHGQRHFQDLYPDPQTNKGNRSATKEPDTFPDEQIDSLTVVSRVLIGASTEPNGPGEYHEKTVEGRRGSELPSPTELDQPSSATQNSSSPKFRSQSSGPPNVRASLTSPHPPKTYPNPITPRLFFLKGKQAPEPSPPNSGYEPYHFLHARALNGRDASGKSQSAYDLNLLYMFWSHFLVLHFNTSMYEEFKCLALEDAGLGSPTEGLSSLIKFYSDSLTSSQPIRSSVARDYVELVKHEGPSADGLAFKQLRASLRNGALNMRNRKTITDIMDPKLRIELEC